MARGGVRPGSGNKGYGKTEAIKANVDKFSPLFWVLMKKWANSKDKDKQKTFLQEYNKIQTKMIPTTMQGDDKGGPIQIQWLQLPFPTPQGDGQTTSTIRVSAG